MAGLNARLSGLPASAASEPAPATAGQLRAAAATLKTTDMTVGGAAKLSEAVRQARRAAWQLDQRQRSDPELAEAAGWLISNAGFMAFDAGRMRDSADLWGVALAAAEEAGNPSLKARVLGSMARQAIWLDRPIEALSRLEHAQELPGLIPLEHAMLWSLKARAEAAAGNASAVERAAHEADEALDQSGDIEDRPWVAHYGWPHQHGDLAGAYTELVLTHGRRGISDVIDRQDAAILGHSPTAKRSRALSLAGLATVEVKAQNELELSLVTGHDAVDAAEGIRSWRLSEDLRRLDDAMAVHGGRADVDELRHRLSLAA